MQPEDMKFCSECGQSIRRRAEICPACGCRQASATPQPLPVFPPVTDPALGRKITLVIFNFFWPGLGNILGGDSRGWTYGLVTWLAIIFAIVTVGLGALGVIGWMVYTDFRGIEHINLDVLRQQQEKSRVEA